MNEKIIFEKLKEIENIITEGAKQSKESRILEIQRLMSKMRIKTIEYFDVEDLVPGLNLDDVDVLVSANWESYTGGGSTLYGPDVESGSEEFEISFSDFFGGYDLSEYTDYDVEILSDTNLSDTYDSWFWDVLIEWAECPDCLEDYLNWLLIQTPQVLVAFGKIYNRTEDFDSAFNKIKRHPDFIDNKEI